MKFWKNTGTLDDLVSELKDCVHSAEAEVAVIGSKPISLAAMPKLRGLFKCGVGTDNVPFKECRDRDIRIGLPSAKTSSVIYEETASFAASTVLRMLYSEVGDLETWEKYPREMARTRRVLVVGLGNIGSRVVDKLKPTVEVIGYDAAFPDSGDLDGLIFEADVVTLHIPLDEANRGFFDKEKLAMMRDGAVLVNTARGPIVDEEALYDELISGRLRAAFDVFWQEPYRGKLAALHPDPFFMTPHVASSCRDFVSGLANDFRVFCKSI
ncbi:D-isomer specific 2-hydroxyacid dehydrogenase, NAD binding domain protein [Verrucomicrobiia bacterium DG1235]|nr:D-isomer specific 2-hydroxyacid dehydrogenase, NAD binding domain protein [Verrucomicrobiae bacterium DG1235]